MKVESEEEQPLKKSKSQKKRDMDVLQKLGANLVELSVAQIKQFDLSTELYDAIILAKRIKREALRRQLQNIGKLIRVADTESIQEMYNNIVQGKTKSAENFQHLEYWREELIKNNKEILDQIIERFPNIDHQQFNQLIRGARKEQGTEKPPKNTRALFRFLRVLVEKKEET
ncbi:MAG: ribosome-associated protein [bacterium]|jgi:ribosome-associated protein